MHKKFHSVMGSFSPNDCDTRHIQPYEAIKDYLCPYCNQIINKGIGHEVVVPRDSIDDRRHFHSGCWYKYLHNFEKTQ